MNNICLKEMSLLAGYLTVMKVPFTAKPLYDGYQIIVETENMNWDVICHFGSYGHEAGLLELMGSIVEKDYMDDVEGWLTADTIAKRVLKIVKAN